ncbi:hypothetical protein D3C74_311160 [compost metagenome]
MKKYIMYRETNETSALVTSIIYSPEKSQEAKDGKGFYTDEEVPEAQTINNMIPTLMISLPDKKFYYDYQDSPSTLEQQLVKLKQADLDNKEAIALLLTLVQPADA